MDRDQVDVQSFFSNPCSNVHAENLLFRTPLNSVSLHLGYPSPEVFPRDEILQAAQQLRHTGADREALQYCEEHGDAELREALKRFYMHSILKVDIRNIVITHGTTTDSLPSLCQLLLDPGDAILLGAPSYLWAIRVFKQFRAKIFTVPTDAEGIEPTGLEVRLKQLRSQGVKVKFIYVMADFHNPLGVSMSIERRNSILDIAYKYNVLLLEDDAYSQLRTKETDVPSIFDLDDHGIVIQMRTFSKIIGPGLRLSWITGQKDLMARLALIRSGGACTYTSRIAAAFLNSGALGSVLAHAQEVYGKRMKALLDSLKLEMRNLAEWTQPAGGFYVWIRFPENIDEALLCQRAAEWGLLVLGGSLFYSDGKHQTALRLSCSFETPDRIELGIQKLASVVKSLNKH